MSVIIPAHNEAQGIVESIQAALSADYPNYEIIVVDDGSSDKTFDYLREHCELEEHSINPSNAVSESIVLSTYKSKKYSRLQVIQKDHTGKADSLNVGIQYSTGVYVCCIDSDSIVTPDALGKLAIKCMNEPTLVALGA